MARPFDLSDIPQAGKTEMAVALEAVVVCGRSRIFFDGASKRDREAIEAVFWHRFTGKAANGGAALVRLWCLVEVFQARRLQHRLMSEGYRFLRAAVVVAGGMRLSVEWGFSPQKMLWAVPAMQSLDALEVARTPRRNAGRKSRISGAKADAGAIKSRTGSRSLVATVRSEVRG